MKKLCAYILIFSMLISFVIAADANIYEAGDFNKNPEQLAVLQERDLIRINWEGKEHQIHVRKIYYPEKQKVDLTAFIEGSEVPYYTTITPKTSLQLDFDRDDKFDLKVSIFNILEEGGKKFVALKLEKLENPFQITTGEAIIEQEDKTLTNYILYILLGSGIILLITVIIFFKRKNLA